ncbi:MAG TPA: LTA synthase family protein [Candidatus Tetragenococcus pullicola]|nr:LTA synthase family protein [Candidatus Tetragenococcus pullicola]
MLSVFFILVMVLKRQLPSNKTWRKIIWFYVIGFYFGLTVYFFNQQKIPLMDWHSLFLPITNFPKPFMISVFSAVVVGWIALTFSVYYESKKVIRVHTFSKKNRRIFITFAILIFLGALAYTSSYWTMNKMDNVRLDQVVFTITQPIKGSDPGQIHTFLLVPFLGALLIAVPMITIMYLFSTCSLQMGALKWRQKPFFQYRYMIGLGLISLLLGLSMSVREIGYADIKAYYFEKTDLYEKYYVDPQKVNFEFPEKKRNLVYIFLESMESSYYSKEFGGSLDDNLLPNMTKLSQEALHFSNGDKLQGMLQVPGANQTASSMVAQTSGLPLRPSANLELIEDLGKNSAEYFPGAYSIGEILNKEGYEQALLIGSKAEFAGRDKYFEQHGNYEIRDYHWAIDKGLIPKDYYVWWGYEDRKLFNYAKDTLDEFSQKDQPFNLTMLTVDTHFEDGYATDETPDLFGDQYANVIHDSDRQLYEFLQWMKQQPFYENTTIVVSGDHLTMDSDFLEEIDPDYQRTVFNLILNAPQKVTKEKTENRSYSAMDMFPTTLAALGVTFDQNRLGMGTNLFSDQPTIIEEIGYDTFEQELMKQSDFYDEKLMQKGRTKSSNSN